VAPLGSPARGPSGSRAARVVAAQKRKKRPGVEAALLIECDLKKQQSEASGGASTERGLGDKRKHKEPQAMSEKVRMRRRIVGMLRKRVGEARLNEVKDPRDARGKRWALWELLCAVLYGLVAGRNNLRETEELTDDMSHAVRRKLGVRRRVPDTTMRNALTMLRPKALRPNLHAVVRAAHRRKALEPDELPFGVASLDGKGTALPSSDDFYAQRQSQPDSTQVIGLMRTVTATLTSSRARPCIDVTTIAASTNEMGTFERALRALAAAYRSLDLFRLITYDAGACSEHNAAVVRELGLHYLLGLKGTQPTLLAEAERVLGSLEPSLAAASSTDTDDEETVVRRLFLTDEMAGFGAFSHCRTVLRVESESFDPSGNRVGIDRRYFISSLPVARLTPKQWLLVVRRHWGVETTHQILDIAFDEDDKPWITADPRGAVVVAVLRRIAYTLMTLFRSVTLRADAQRSKPWRRLLHEVLLALVASSEADLEGLRRHRAAPA
jgi:hypothetical protein